MSYTNISTDVSQTKSEPTKEDYYYEQEKDVFGSLWHLIIQCGNSASSI